MADLFQFPDVETDRRQVTMFSTPPPWKRDAQQARGLAHRLGISGEVEDHGTTLVVRDEAGALELFMASDSLRVTRWPRGGSEADGDIDLPEPSAAMSKGRGLLEELELAVDGLDAPSIAYSELARKDRRSGREMSGSVALHLNHGFRLDELPVVGPGAKVQITLGHGGALLGAYRFWRKPRPGRTAGIISAEVAMDRLCRDGAYAQLDAKTARVVIHDVRLAYYGLPPRELQESLIPVYVFDGTVTTRQFPRYDFTRYVVAMDVEARDVKRVRMAQRLTPVF